MAADAGKIYDPRSIDGGSKQPSTIEATPQGDTH
jgi:hypothetical protein